ncbi:unnamed protein product [Orchesella dallaii]|uniref:Lipase domain-containing protein n=1 Tax=Orchesella dallaii TaxID=48710 RepID=A0ABP1RZ54_9HEXA
MTVVNHLKEEIPQPGLKVDQVDQPLFIWRSSLNFSFQPGVTISVTSIRQALFSVGKAIVKKITGKVFQYLETKMERVFDLVRGAGLVTGHILGQAITLSIFRDHIHDIHAEMQQMAEAFGRAVPIVVADAISPALAETLVKSSNPCPWEVARIRPKLRLFRRGKQPIEITWKDFPDEVVGKFEQFGAFETTRIVFLTHGFIHHIDVDWMADMKNAMLEHENMTVVVLGWGGGANIGVDRYELAAKNIEPVGCWLGNHLREIKRRKPDTYLWGVGHSLGAHLMGFAGKCSRSLDRITGLDPAGPNFETELTPSRLTAADAKFVDVIHTDGYSRPWTLQSITAPTNHYGTLVPMGTVDFYPNWGHSQPGCENFSFIGSHNRAFELFTWTVFRPGKFKTNMKLKDSPTYMTIKKDVFPDEEETEMGFYCDGGKGNYYIEVNEEDITLPLVFGIP